MKWIWSSSSQQVSDYIDLYVSHMNQKLIEKIVHRSTTNAKLLVSHKTNSRPEECIPWLRSMCYSLWKKSSSIDISAQFSKSSNLSFFHKLCKAYPSSQMTQIYVMMLDYQPLSFQRCIMLTPSFLRRPSGLTASSCRRNTSFHETWIQTHTWLSSAKSCKLTFAPWFFFFCVPQLHLWGSPFWVRFLRMRPFFNPTIEVVTFRLHGLHHG